MSYPERRRGIMEKELRNKMLGVVSFKALQVLSPWFAHII